MAIFKTYLVMSAFVVACYCIDIDSSDVMESESRAKKKKLKVLGYIIALILSKIAITKVALGIFFWWAFQKFFVAVGVFLNMYFGKSLSPSLNQTSQFPPDKPYDTVSYSYDPASYSYDPPDSYGLPLLENIEDFNGVDQHNNNWPYNRRKHN